eukprot:g55187.t1
MITTIIEVVRKPPLGSPRAPSPDSAGPELSSLLLLEILRCEKSTTRGDGHRQAGGTVRHGHILVIHFSGSVASGLS